MRSREKKCFSALKQEVRNRLLQGGKTIVESFSLAHLRCLGFISFAMADDELQKKLTRRNQINESEEGAVLPSTNVFNPYTEFKEFSRKQIQDFQKTFNK
jgi:hypothetical protein